MRKTGQCHNNCWCDHHQEITIPLDLESLISITLEPENGIPTILLIENSWKNSPNQELPEGKNIEELGVHNKEDYYHLAGLTLFILPLILADCK